MNWADDFEQETTMDTANNTINTISTEEGEGQTQGAESTGKETSIQDEVNLMQSQRKTDNETSQMVEKTSPKRTKKQKTDLTHHINKAEREVKQELRTPPQYQ